MAFCTKCGNKVMDNAVFCSNCGARVVSVEQASPTAHSVPAGLSFPIQLTISRESQFTCAGNAYKVIVNGIDLGKIGVGKTLTTTVNSPEISVEIRCASVLMTGIHATFQLKITESNPRVHFKLRYGGSIDATVAGADILDFNGTHDGKFF